MIAGPKQLRVLVVSASPYTRYVVSGELSSASDVFVVGTARTVDEIAQRQAMLRPDLAVVDLDSPRDLSELHQILADRHLRVLALCPHSRTGAELAFAALEAGAVDVLARTNAGAGEVFFTPNLLRSVRGVARTKKQAGRLTWPNLESRCVSAPQPFQKGDLLVVVSASTGGLGPLIQLLAALPSDVRASLLVLSRLPAFYVHWFLQRMERIAACVVKQARDGQKLERGVAFVAPWGYSFSVDSTGQLTLDQSGHEREIDASADATLSSLAAEFGPTVLAIILSGVGCDGVRGALEVRNAGGQVIVQETATCLAEEIPRAAIEAGAATAVVRPESIVDEIVRQVAMI